MTLRSEPRFARIILLAAFACGGAWAQQAGEAPPNTASLTMSGVDLYMHRIAPTGGEAETPTFWVHAESGRLDDGGQVWSLDTTEAVIYRENEVDLTLRALEGRFDQGKETAELRGEVLLMTGQLEVVTETILWDNDERLVTTDAPLRVRTPQADIEASALLLDPDSGAMELTNARGSLQLSGEQK